jgi:hypothetical protein
MVIAYILKVILDSWIVGHVSTFLLRRLIIVNKRWQLNLIGNEELNKVLGVGIMKWFLVNSFIKHANRRLQVPGGKPKLEQLTQLSSTVGHDRASHCHEHHRESLSRITAASE